MDQQVIVWIIAAVVVVALLAAFWIVSRQRRREHLRERFGPEYERVVSEEGDRGRAEQVLSQREERVKKLDIRPLQPSLRSDFVSRWRQVQARFVDDPRGAIGDADALIGDAMKARGYPVGDFEQRAADISVEHPDVVTDYRAAHRVARQREASTEELRRAMVHYRSLFEDVVGRNEPVARDERAPRDERAAERVDEREETHR